MTHHEAEENYIIETITKHEPKAKDIKTETKPNGDMTFVFKVGRKTHRIELTNLEFERAMVGIKKPYVVPMKQYMKDVENAMKPVREEHAAFLKEFSEAESAGGKDFVLSEIENYFSLESDLGLTK